MIIEAKILLIRALSRGKNILNVAVGGKRAAIFFLSSCLFAAGWLSQLAFDFFYPGSISPTRTAFVGTVFLGLVLFGFGMGSVFIEAFGFKRKSIKRGFARIDFRIASLSVHAASTVAMFVIEMWRRKFPNRELRGALPGRAWQGRAGRTKTSGAKQDF